MLCVSEPLHISEQTNNISFVFVIRKVVHTNREEELGSDVDTNNESRSGTTAELKSFVSASGAEKKDKNECQEREMVKVSLAQQKYWKLK